MKDFRNLKVWELSHKVALSIYDITALFPKDEIYGLTSQIRRASVSIPTNISEGCGRYSDADFKRFLQIGFGSACELEYLLLLSNELKYVSKKDYDQIISEIIEVKKMLSGLIKKLKEKS
ncbi:MAG: four helix bundle protein [Ignavibacteriales bacterium]|nr:four helix bundle protein [Ignavibacteriales bacterium]